MWGSIDLGWIWLVLPRLVHTPWSSTGRWLIQDDPKWDNGDSLVLGVSSSLRRAVLAISEEHAQCTSIFPSLCNPWVRGRLLLEMEMESFWELRVSHLLSGFPCFDSNIFSFLLLFSMFGMAYLTSNRKEGYPLLGRSWALVFKFLYWTITKHTEKYTSDKLVASWMITNEHMITIYTKK